MVSQLTIGFYMHFRLSNLPLFNSKALPDLGSRKVSAFDLFLPRDEKVDSVCIPDTLFFHAPFIYSSLLRGLKFDHAMAASLDLLGGRWDSL